MLLKFGAAGAFPQERRLEAVHLLNRLGYGPRPGDIERTIAIGANRFIAEQMTSENLQMKAKQCSPTSREHTSRA